MTRLPAALEVVRDVMSGFSPPWAIAGGWALELTLGPLRRAHADLDLAAFREDQYVLRAHLAEWHWTYVDAGQHRPWMLGQWLAHPVHELHAAPHVARRPALEVLLNEREGTDWVFRRDSRVRLPLIRAIQSSPIGLPVLAPEIVLLYKARAPRRADEADFTATATRLPASAQAWLAAALSLVHSGHPWARELAVQEA